MIISTLSITTFLLVIGVSLVAGQQDDVVLDCIKEAYWQDDRWADWGRMCQCIDEADGTLALHCVDDCETCYSNSEVCGIKSTTTYFPGEPLQTTCFEHTKGALQGTKVCFTSNESDKPSWFFDDAGDYTLDINGVECNSCKVTERKCNKENASGFHLNADCTNTAIGRIVDECDSDAYFDELLGFLFNDNDSSTVGSCDVAPIQPAAAASTVANQTNDDDDMSLGSTNFGAMHIALLSLAVSVLALIIIRSLDCPPPPAPAAGKKRANGYERMERV